MQKRIAVGVIIILLLLGFLVAYEWNSALERSRLLERGEPLPPDPLPVTQETPAWLIPIYVLVNYLSKAYVCLGVAFLIAGAMETFISKQVIMQHLSSRKLKSYLVGVFGGPMLSVCSCSIIPIFAGIRRRGAGLGPALGFLLAAPSINVAAILLTISLISWKVAVGRIILAYGAALFTSYLIAKIYELKADAAVDIAPTPANPSFDEEEFEFKAAFKEWMNNTWFFVRSIIPLILIGIIVVGIIKVVLTPEIIARYLGEGIIPIMISSAMGVIIYTPTLVEVPFIRGLLEMNMGTGAALAFLLTGPALSLPNMLGVSKIISWRIIASYAVVMWLMGVIGGLIFAFFVPSITLY
jgi:uncharacterized membrane protein YraQ (UPF0718 family)